MRAEEFIIEKKQQKTKPVQPNPVAKNAMASVGGGGFGAHKDKKAAAKRGDEKHKKNYAMTAEASKPRNPTRDHLRRYPVPADQVARPVKKDEKKGVAEGAMHYDEILAQKVFDQNPNLDASGRAEEVFKAGWPIAVQDLGKKRAQWMFGYDEDFPSEFVTAYAHLQKQGVSEGEDDWGSMNKRDFKRKEMEYELRNEPPNNIQVSINGKPWKVFAGRGRPDSQEEFNHLRKMKSWAASKSAATGKKWEVYLTGAPASESVKEDTTIPFNQCPSCKGPIVHESQLTEKQDACYHKVKSRYKVWPSAYASGALVQCRKKGASNWGKKG